MGYVVLFAAGTVVTWLTLLVVLPIAQKLADFGLPGWRDLLWQLAVVAVVVNGVSLALAPFSGILSWLASSVVFWVMMVKWFDVDLFGAVVIVAVNIVIGIIARVVLVAVLVGR